MFNGTPSSTGMLSNHVRKNAQSAEDFPGWEQDIKQTNKKGWFSIRLMQELLLLAAILCFFGTYINYSMDGMSVGVLSSFLCVSCIVLTSALSFVARFLERYK